MPQTAELMRDQKGEMFLPKANPISLSKLLQETAETGSMSDSYAALSFADSNGSDHFEASFAFEMSLESDDDDADDDHQHENTPSTPSRRQKRSSDETLLPSRSPRSPALNRSHSESGGRQRRISSGAPPPRRLPQRSLTTSSSKLSRSLSNLSSGGQPLRREQSKLCLLSKSNHNSRHETVDENGKDSLSRNFRRRTVQPTISTGLSDDSFDGNSSSAQLQVGEMVMLGTKELSTSLHLKRRMPRQRRAGSKREVLAATSTQSSSSSDDEETVTRLPNRMAIVQ